MKCQNPNLTFGWLTDKNDVMTFSKKNKETPSRLRMECLSTLRAGSIYPLSKQKKISKETDPSCLNDVTK